MREKRRIQFFAKTKTFPNEIYEKENAKAPIFLASGLSYCILKIGEHQCMPVHFSEGEGPTKALCSMKNIDTSMN